MCRLPPEIRQASDRSDFTGAYRQDDLIGFIRMVYVDNIPSTLQVIGNTSHFNKKQVTVVIAKAVEICYKKKMSYCVYDKFKYDIRTDSPLIEFKRRKGFEQIRFTTCEVLLTLKRRVSVRCTLHRGWSGILPPLLASLLVGLRSGIVGPRLGGRNSGTPVKFEIGVAEARERTPAS